MADSISIGTAHQTAAPAPETGKAPATHVSRETADSFKSAMREKDGGAPGKGGEEKQPGLAEKDKGSAGPGEGKPAQDACLPDMFSLFAKGGAVQSGQVALQSGTAEQAGAGEASALCESLAARILVSDPKQDGSPEVRIALKDSVLKDTEIVLRHEPDRLVVNLNTGNASSQQALLGARGELQDRLRAAGETVQITVSLESDRDGSGHDPRRSRGLDYLHGEEK